MTYEERAEALRARTKALAIEVIRFVRTLPPSEEARVMSRQLLRSATSVAAANYRAVCRARTRAISVAKLDIVVEEADETASWLELLDEVGVTPGERLAALRQEAEELTRIFAARRTAIKDR